MGNFINKSMDLERPKKHDRIAEPSTSSPHHLIYFLKLQMYFSAGTRPQSSKTKCALHAKSSHAGIGKTF